MENKYILFDTTDNDDNFGYMTIFTTSKSLHYHGQKSVPVGQGYLIVSQSQLPENFGVEMGMYDVDFSNPMGFGSGSDYTISGSRIEGTFPFSTYEDWVEFYKDTDLI